MSNIFAWPFCFSFAPAIRANARRPAASGPLIGLLSLSFCLLTFPGAQALANDHFKYPGHGGSAYTAANRPQRTSAPTGLNGKAPAGVPWYADQAQRRQAAAVAPQATRPVYGGAPSNRPQSRARQAAAAKPQAGRPSYGLPSYVPQDRVRRAAAARTRPVKPTAGGEVSPAPDRPYLATPQAEDSGWKVPTAWRARGPAKGRPAYPGPSRYSRAKAEGFVQRGVASWYGGRFHGRQTASGERYNQNELTAAHKTLPFGSLVEVINQNNGRNVVVRINDRGPFYKGRVIDLSRGAAEMLDIDGLAPVTIKVVSRQAEGPMTLN